MAYASAVDLKTFLGISGSGDDTLLAALLTRAQAYIEGMTDRVFEATGDTTKYFDALEDVTEDAAGRRNILLLGKWDLCAITSVVNGDGVTLASDAYVTEPRNETPYWALRIKANQSAWWTYGDTPENAIAITGRWAYSTTAPADVVQATVELAAYLYRRRGVEGTAVDQVAVSPSGVTMAPRGLPELVKTVIGNYQRVGR